MNTARVHALVELVGHDAQVSVLHHNVPGDGGEDALAVFVPAEGDKRRTSEMLNVSHQNYRGVTPSV